MNEYGWISVYRKIKNHRFFMQERTFSFFEAWIDLLLSANHKDVEILLRNNQIVQVKRGQFLTSQKKLAERWGWSRKKVSKFFKELELDKSAHIECTSKYTLVTLTKYDFYQSSSTTDAHQNKHQKHINGTSDAHQTHTNNNDNKLNNDNKEGEDPLVRKGNEKFANLRTYK